mgnify:CR=1 FL=1
MEQKVNFFLIGAAKSGTTSLYERMSAHEEVYLSPLKEPNFFSTDIDPKNFSDAFKANTQLDLSRYFKTSPLPQQQVGFVSEMNDYNRLFEAVESESVIGECSTSYLYSRTAAQEVRTYNAQAKILVVLRNPVDRLFSHYLMARKYGFTADDVRIAIEKDQRLKEKGWGQSELFVELGQYAEQLNRWYKEFPSEQIKVLFTEELKKEETWIQLYRWLGIKAHLPEEGSTNEDQQTSDPKGVANSAGLARFEKLNRWITEKGLKKALGKILPSIIKRKLLYFYYTDVNLPTLNEADREYIASFYDKDRARLTQLINRDLPWN